MWKQQSQTERSLRQRPPAVVVFRLLPIVSLAADRQTPSQPTDMVRAMGERRVQRAPNPEFQWPQLFDVAAYHTSLARQAPGTGRNVLCAKPDLRRHIPVSAPRPRCSHGCCFAPSDPWSVWHSRKLATAAHGVLQAASDQRVGPNQLHYRRQPPGYQSASNYVAYDYHPALPRTCTATRAYVVSSESISPRRQTFEGDISPSYIYSYSGSKRCFSRCCSSMGRSLWPQIGENPRTRLGNQRPHTRPKHVAQCLATYVLLPRRSRHPSDYQWSRRVLCTTQKPLPPTSRPCPINTPKIFRMVLPFEATMTTKQHTFLTINPAMTPSEDFFRGFIFILFFR